MRLHCPKLGQLLLVCYSPLAEPENNLDMSQSRANSYVRWQSDFISNTASTRRSVSRRRAAHCSLSVSPWTILSTAATLDEAMALKAQDDDEDDGFECLGSMTAEERAAESRRVAEAAGNVLEIPESPARTPHTPEAVALPPVPTFMGRGTARRPVEAPAPAQAFGARANYDPVLDE